MILLLSLRVYIPLLLRLVDYPSRQPYDHTRNGTRKFQPRAAPRLPHPVDQHHLVASMANTRTKDKRDSVRLRQHSRPE